MHRLRRIRRPALAVVVALLLVLPAAAHAAFPGVNGKIAFTRDEGFQDRPLFSINPGGTGMIQMTDGLGQHNYPRWSPDGRKLLFTRGGEPFSQDVYVVNADGSGQTNLTNTPDYPRDLMGAWSPDGTKIVFVRQRSYGVGGTFYDLYVMNSDGTGQTQLTSDLDSWEYRPAWSPDGQRIAFVKALLDYCEGTDEVDCFSKPEEIYVVNADGTGQTNITNTPTQGEGPPDWSPDGSKIVFDCPEAGICTMSGEGSGRAAITADGYAPKWSPDGSKIVFSHDDPTQIYTVNANGSQRTRLTNDSTHDLYPDWQPLPAPHSHPVGASPVRVSLVPAYQPCEAGNADFKHGAPLDFPSCSNPSPRSSTVTFGSSSIGFARLIACWPGAGAPICNPAGSGFAKPDVRILGSIRDVKCRGTIPAGCAPGSDYNPNADPSPYTSPGNGVDSGGQPPCFPGPSSATACIVGADVTWIAELPRSTATTYDGSGRRITDLDNDPLIPEPGTVVDTPFPIMLDCIPTADATLGSTCGVSTTANALVPGVVKSGKAAVWEIGEIELKDSGPDGRRGNSDDEVFATQGIFLP